MKTHTKAHPKKGSRRPVWRRAFLVSLAETANVSRACGLSGIGRRTAYNLRSRDADFAAEWGEAIEEACDALELEARRRAVTGSDRPVYQGGKLVGHTREYSDVLLIFLLKANRPEKYRDNRRVEVGGPNGQAPIPIDIHEIIHRVYGEKAEADKTRAG